LHTVHSRRSTTFLVAKRLIRKSRQLYTYSWPSFGRQAWSDHRNPSAYGRNDAYPGQTRTPYRSCTGSPCGDCRLLVTDTRPCCIHTCASGTSYPCSMSCGSLERSPSVMSVRIRTKRHDHVLLTVRGETRESFLGATLRLALARPSLVTCSRDPYSSGYSP